MTEGKGRWTVTKGGRILTPVDMSESDIRFGIAHTALDSGWSYDDLVSELDRRSRNRQTTTAIWISALGLLVAVAAFAVSILR